MSCPWSLRVASSALTALAAFACLGSTAGPAAAQAGAESRPTTAASQPQAPRPDTSPVVAVGSRIAWNVPYAAASQGPGAAQQVLDVYAPANARNAPVVVFVHGGEWLKGDKAEVSFKPKFLNEQGIVFVSVNYRLSGVARHPAQVDDVAAAVRWLRDHVTDHGGDPRNIVLLGHSAGTHLVTLVALDPRPLAKVGLTPADLCGVVSWSGSAFDLVAKHEEGGEMAKYIEQAFGAAESGLRDASPAMHVGAAKALPRFLFASPGQTTRSKARDAAQDMVDRLRAVNARAEAVVLAGKTHFTANHELGMPNGGEELGAVLLGFVRGGNPAAARREQDR